jgi:hypothetical protein
MTISDTSTKTDSSQFKNFLSDVFLMLEEIESSGINSIIKKEYKSIIKIQKKHVIDLFTKYKNTFELELIETDNFGLNFLFIGFTGRYFFPAVLWYCHSYNNGKKSLNSLFEREFNTLIDLQIAISFFVTELHDTRVGYSGELLESIRFHFYLNERRIPYSELELELEYFDFFPLYLPEYETKNYKKHLNTINVTVGEYLIPNNAFWNINSLVLDHSLFDIPNEEFPVFPYWLMYDKSSRPLLTVQRISSDQIKQYKQLKKYHLTSYSYFINLNNLESKGNSMYHFTLPDLFKEFNKFEKNNFQFSDTYYDRRKYYPLVDALLPPNWILHINSPIDSNNYYEGLIFGENDTIKNFTVHNLDIIIHLFNTFHSNNKYIHNIFLHDIKKNIFTNIFLKRLRLDISTLGELLIISIQIDKRTKTNLEIKDQIKNFFSAIYPTGIILDYFSGILFYCQISKIEKNHLHKLAEFLELFNFPFKIHTKIKEYGFLNYHLPPSNLFVNKSWDFPPRDLLIDSIDFSKTIQHVLDLENNFASNSINKEKISNFKNFIQKL